MTEHDHVHVDADEPDAVPVGSAKPYPKVLAGGAAGAASVVVVWLVGLAGVEVPAGVSSAFTTLITFAAAYLKSE